MNGTIHLDVVRTREGLGALRPAWCELQEHPNTDFDHYQLVLASCGSGREPYVLVLRQEGVIRALAVGRVEALPVRVKCGYAALRLGTLRTLSIMTGGLLGEWTEAGAGAALDLLGSELRHRALEAVIMPNVPCDGAWMKALGCATRPGGPRFISAPHPHRLLHLPESPGALWAKLSSKHRYWVKRIRRKLDEDFGSEAVFRKWAPPQDLGAFCREVEVVTASTYQRGLGVGFAPDDFHRKRCELFAARGEFAGYLLQLGGRPAAFWLGCVRGGTFYSEYTGYDPSFREHEPGTALFAFLLEDLIRAGVVRFDFGTGDALYKQRFADTCRQECDLHLYRPALRGYLTAALERSASYLNASLLNSRVGGRLRRWWRDRATEHPPAGADGHARPEPGAS